MATFPTVHEMAAKYSFGPDMEVASHDLQDIDSVMQRTVAEQCLVELKAAAQYLRYYKDGDRFGSAKEYAAAIGMDKSRFSRATTVIERGISSLLVTTSKGKRPTYFITDDEVVATLWVYIADNGYKAVTGLYSALTAKDDSKEWSLSHALATVLAKARKEGIDDGTVLETLLGLVDDAEGGE